MPIYQQCKKTDEDVDARVARLIGRYHGGLRDAGVTIDTVFAYAKTDVNGDPVGPAIKHRGVVALAYARIVNLKDRAKGLADGEIVIDGDQWSTWSDAEKDALLDHEILHFDLKTGKGGAVVRDDQDRPSLKVRPHDVEVGWFIAIADRHGRASFERQQAEVIFDQYGQHLFPFAAPTHAERAEGWMQGRGRKLSPQVMAGLAMIGAGFDKRLLIHAAKTESRKNLEGVASNVRSYLGEDAVRIVEGWKKQLAGVVEANGGLSTYHAALRLWQDLREAGQWRACSMPLLVAAICGVEDDREDEARAREKAEQKESETEAKLRAEAEAEERGEEQPPMAVTREGKTVVDEETAKRNESLKQVAAMMKTPASPARTSLRLADLGMDEDHFRRCYYPSLLVHGGGTLVKEAIVLDGFPINPWIGVPLVEGRSGDYCILPLHPSDWKPPEKGGVHCGKTVVNNGVTYRVGADAEAIAISIGGEETSGVSARPESKEVKDNLTSPPRRGGKKGRAA